SILLHFTDPDSHPRHYPFPTRRSSDLQVIARKWRPQTFQDLVGQQHVTETLKNAIVNNRVAHAYIFSGARGVGKTTARAPEKMRSEEHTSELQSHLKLVCRLLLEKKNT